jgi:hypothetical protein
MLRGDLKKYSTLFVVKVSIALVDYIPRSGVYKLQATLVPEIITA